MQLSSILSLLALAAPLINASSSNDFTTTLDTRAGSASQLKHEYRVACQTYANCVKACKSSAKTIALTKTCIAKNCAEKNEEADTLLEEWKRVSDAAQACVKPTV